MKTGIFLILSFFDTLIPNIVLAANAPSGKNAKNPFNGCFLTYPSEQKKYCTKLPETKKLRNKLGLILQVGRLLGYSS